MTKVGEQGKFPIESSEDEVRQDYYTIIQGSL